MPFILTKAWFASALMTKCCGCSDAVYMGQPAGIDQPRRATGQRRFRCITRHKTARPMFDMKRSASAP
jgi:hypothetical protein